MNSNNYKTERLYTTSDNCKCTKLSETSSSSLNQMSNGIPSASLC